MFSNVSEFPPKSPLISLNVLKFHRFPLKVCLFLDFLVALEVGPHQGIRLGVQLGVGLGLDLDAFGRQKVNHSGHAKVEFTGDFAQAYRFV